MAPPEDRRPVHAVVCQQGNAVFHFQAVGREQVGDAVGVGAQFAVGDRGLRVDERGFVGPALLDVGVDEIGNRVVLAGIVHGSCFGLVDRAREYKLCAARTGLNGEAQVAGKFAHYQGERMDKSTGY